MAHVDRPHVRPGVVQYWPYVAAGEQATVAGHTPYPLERVVEYTLPPESAVQFDTGAEHEPVCVYI